MIVFGIRFSVISRLNMETPFVKNGITLLSPHDPVRRCEKTADGIEIKDRTLYFCPSPLYGWGLSLFLSRLEKENSSSCVLCIEADPELYEISIKNIDAGVAKNNRFRITNVTQAGRLRAFVRSSWGARAFRRVEVIRLTGGWRLFSGLYESLCETLRSGIASDWSNAMTLTKLGRLYVRNALRNLSLIPQFTPVTELSFGVSPVLVAGAGPSLDETLESLAARFGKDRLLPENRPFKIICADTCLGALKDRGIKPDLVVILESQHWNLNDFTGIKGWEVTAAADLSALPASARMLGGKNFLFMTPWTDLQFFKRLNNAGLLPACIPPLGSVGLAAVEIAKRTTGGNIILCGLDFSFTASKYHARGTPGHRSALNTQSRFKRIMNNAAYGDHAYKAVSKSGAGVYSDPAMRRYRDLFEQEFGGSERIFDIGGSGLSLGVKTLSITEALNMLALNKKNTEEIERKTAHTNTEEKKQILSSFIKNEKEMLAELRSILKGETAACKERVSYLIDECDYLWAHFPDYAGGLKPDSENLSFLKRISAELDPMLRCLNCAL